MVSTRTIAVLATAAAVAVLGSPAAMAADEPDPTTGTVAGHTYGPEDGYEVVEEVYPLVDATGPIEVFYQDAPAPDQIVPMTTWGTSYATSTEIAQFVYYGKAKAGGNVYSGKRIIQVCIWYSHPGRTSSTVCSSASSNGSSWSAGSEKTLTFVDNLSLNWPQTSFHVSTTRVSPNIF